MDFKQWIRDIPDFPKPGILFRDITPLLSYGPAFRAAIDQIAERYEPQNIDRIVGIDARGFLFASALAYALGKGLAIIRKKGKLPYRSRSHSYALEYGSDTLEIHEDAIAPQERVVLIDDLLATGGTAGAAVQLIEGIGGEVVECAFVIELKFLKGREVLGGHSVFSLVEY